MATSIYNADAPTAAEVRALAGLTLLEFGVDWCGHCQAALAPVAQALSAHPVAQHLRVEDGAGRPLGRAFKIKLWPTLVLLVDGQERGRVVRPTRAGDVLEALRQVDPARRSASGGG